MAPSSVLCECRVLLLLLFPHQFWLLLIFKTWVLVHAESDYSVLSCLVALAAIADGMDSSEFVEAMFLVDSRSELVSILRIAHFFLKKSVR